MRILISGGSKSIRKIWRRYKNSTHASKSFLKNDLQTNSKFIESSTGLLNKLTKHFHAICRINLIRGNFTSFNHMKWILIYYRVSTISSVRRRRNLTRKRHLNTTWLIIKINTRGIWRKEWSTSKGTLRKSQHTWRDPRKSRFTCTIKTISKTRPIKNTRKRWIKLKFQTTFIKRRKWRSFLPNQRA